MIGDRTGLATQDVTALDVLGVEEPWCADFVSWIMREAGLPLSNPNSGHWRIPGVYTWQEYYQSQSRFQEVGDGYRLASVRSSSAKMTDFSSRLA